MPTRRRVAPSEAANDVAAAVDIQNYLREILSVEDARVFDLTGTAVIALYTTPMGETRRVVSALLVLDERVTSETLRSVPLALIENMGNAGDAPAEMLDALPTLTRDGRSSDDFSQLVARYYRALVAANVANPAAELQRRLDGVPLATIHGWIREARLRGHLPAARIRRSRGAADAD